MELGMDEPAGLAVPLDTFIERLPAVPWPERCLDLTVLLIALPLLVVVAAVIALAIYLDSPGPVIYRSRRVGRDGVEFEMIKFRKMLRDAPSHPVTLDDDARFTPIGRFLAATRLDELPQVINVLRGEMRLVGPRPELDCFVAQFADEYAEILTVTPGMTGRAQLRFVEERLMLTGPSPTATYTDQVLPAKLRIDLDYVHSHTLWTDLEIIGLTLLLPVTLLAGRMLRNYVAIRRWIPSIMAGGLLGMVFIVLASRLP